MLNDLQSDPFQPHLELHPLGGKLAGCQAVNLAHSYQITLALLISDREITLLDVGGHDQVSIGQLPKRPKALTPGNRKYSAANCWQSMWLHGVYSGSHHATLKVGKSADVDSTISAMAAWNESDSVDASRVARDRVQAEVWVPASRTSEEK